MKNQLMLTAAMMAAMVVGAQKVSSAQAVQGRQAEQTAAQAQAQQTGQAAQPAQAQPAAAEESGSKHMNVDAHFVKHAAEDGLFEVEAGKLAEQKSQSQEIKQLAQRLVQDHTKANEQLATLAQSKGWQVPQQTDEVCQAKLAHLQKLSGEQFDHAYLYGQVSDHVMDILKFRDGSQKVQDAQLKQWVETQLPILMEHYQMAAKAANWNPSNEAQPAGAHEHGTGGAARSTDAAGSSGSSDIGTGTGVKK